MESRVTETLERIYERWGRGDFRAGAELFDPHIMFVIRRGFPESGAYAGPEAVAGYMAGFLEPWERITISALGIVPAGDSAVVEVAQRGVGEGSGAGTELRYFHVWTFRGERVIRFESVRERADALAAVGLA